MVDRVHGARVRFFAWGGLGAVVCAGALPWGVSRAVDLSAFQALLLCAAGLLVGLSAVQRGAKWQAGRLRSRAREYCEERGIALPELVRASRRVPSRWFFFSSLWNEEKAPVDRP